MLNPAMSPRRLPAVVPPRPRGRLEPAGAGTPWPAHPHALGPPLFWGLRPQEKHPGAGERRGGQGTEGTRWPPPPSGVGARGATPGVPRLAACHGAWGHSVMGGGGAWGHCAVGDTGLGGLGALCYGGVPHSQCPIPSATYSQCPQSSFPVPPVPIPSAPYSQHPKSPFPVLPIPSTPSSHSQCPHPHTHGSDSWADFRSPLKGRGAPSPAAGTYRRTPGSPRSVQGGAMVTAWGEGRCPPAPGDRHWDGDTSSPAGGLQPPSC